MSVWSGLPTSAGSNNALLHNGSAGDATNYQYVDDTLGSHDSDTTYVSKVSAGFADDTYNFSNDSSYNGATINSVTVFGYFRRLNTSRTCTKSFVAKLSSNYSYANSGAVSETSYTLYSGVFSTKPGGGSWTSSDVDSAEFGIHIASNTLTEFRCTQVYIVVDYTAAAGGPGVPGLVSPTNNSTIWTIRPNLIVTSVDSGGGTITYEYQVDTVTGFSSPDATISGCGSGVAVGTGWQVSSDLVQGTSYYWRCRSNNGTTDSAWSTTSGFVIGTFPAATGLKCDFSTDPIVTANGYPNFSATFIGSGSGGAAEYQQLIIMTGTSSGNFSSPYFDSGWVDIATTNSGSEAPIYVCSGVYLGSFVETATSGYYWALRFKNASGIYGSWAGAFASGVYLTGTVTPYGMLRSGISYGDEYNMDPTTIRFSGSDAYGYVPWDNVVHIRANISVRNTVASSYFADFMIRTWSGYHPSPSVGMSDPWEYDGTSQDVNLFSGSAWNQLTVSGGFVSSLSCPSGITYSIHFYDGDVFGSGNRFDTEAKINSITFLCSGHKSFKMDRKKWVNNDLDERIKLSFGTNHVAYPSGYTASLQLDTGAAKVVASNLPVEAMPDAFSNVVYANGKTHIVYTGDYEASSSGWTIYIVTKDHATGTWGTPYKLDSAYTGNDTHHGPALCADKLGYLHVFYGTHSAYTTEQLKYKRSVQANKSGSGDDGTWTTVSSIAYPVTYPVPIVNSSGHIYVVFRTQDPGSPGSYNGSEPNLGFIYTTDRGETWSGTKYFAYNPGFGRTYMHGTYFDRKLDRFHAAISFIDAGNRSLGVWYAYTDDFITWKNASGTTCGTTSTVWSGSTLMSGSAPNTPSLVEASTTKRSIFGRPIIIDNQGRPHIFMTSDQTRAPFYQAFFLDNEQTIYYPGSLWHSYWNGSSWISTEISNQIDVGVWASNYSIKPVIDADDNITVYINEKPLREYTIQPTASGSFSSFTASVSPSYSGINYHRDIYSTDNYIVISGGSTGVSTFSGNYSVVPTGYINSVSVEMVCEKPIDLSLYFYPVLRVNGTLYSGVVFNWLDCYGNSTLTSNTEVPYLFKWYLNPSTGAPWTRADLNNVEFGVSKASSAGILRVYDLQLRVDAIINTHPNQFAGEVVALYSRDNGATWAKEYITNYSQRGVPQLSIKNDFSNNQLEMVWSTGNKLYYYNVDKTNHYNADGSDIRLYYGDTEIDRVADRWNNETTTIEFRLQSGIAADAQFGSKDYYIYNLDRDAGYAKDNPKNVYKFYESFEDYPALQIFPSIKRLRQNITQPLFSYNSTDDNSYNATYDAKDETTGIACSGALIDLFAYSHQTISTEPVFQARVSNSETWNSGVVVASSINGLSIQASGGYSCSIVITGISTTGTSVKVDYGSFNAGGTDAPKVSGFINSISYITQVSGWVPINGYFQLRDAPPFETAYIFAGGKALEAATNNSVLQKTIGTGLNNVYIEFAINPARVDGPSKRAIFLSNNTQKFGVGVDLWYLDGGQYKRGSPYYCSGVTDTTATGFNNIYDQSWHSFKILVRSGLCDAWWGNSQICTGINALSSGFNNIIISGAGSTNYDGDCFDYIKVYDYLESGPVVTPAAKEYKCINFLAAIQGKEKLLLGFNYVISGWFTDTRVSVWDEYFYQVDGNLRVNVAGLQTIDLDKKIIAEYQGFTRSDCCQNIEINQLINNNARLSIEYVGEKEFYSKYNIAKSSELEFDSKIFYCGTKSAELYTKISIEPGQIVFSLCNMASSYIDNIESSAKIFFNYTEEIIAFAKIINGYLVGKVFDNNLSVDNIKSIAADFNIVASWIKNIEADNKLNISVVAIKELFVQIISGYSIMLNHNSSVLPSWLSDIASDFNINIDELSCIVSIDTKINAEPGLVAGNAIAFPVNYLMNIDANRKIPFNWLGAAAVNFDANIPIDFVGTVECLSTVPLSNLLNKEFLQKIDFQFVGNIVVDTKLPESTLKNIDNFSNFYISAAETIKNNFNILSEQLVSAGVNLVNMPAEYKKQLFSDFNFGVDFTGAAQIQLNLQVPVDFIASVDNFGNITVDRLNAINSFNIANIDYIKLVEAIYQNVPVDVMSVLLSNSSIITENLVSNTSDFNINLECLSDSVLSFSSKVLIDYGVGFNKTIKLPVEAQLSVLALAKTINEWLSKVDGIAKITFSPSSNVQSSLNCRIDFGKGVIINAKIPLERLIRLASDKKIPIWERSALIEAFLFQNILLVAPGLENIGIYMPGVANILISGIPLNAELSGPATEDENIQQPTTSGITFIGQKS